jgi:DeoR/GlpR family transcriptional regulator of sugar metabolism
VRVRGGAIARHTLANTNGVASPLLSPKALKNADEKQVIARWAAGMVEDGDVIMLDASSTVLHIAPFLHDRRNLTVFTNGIQVAQALATEPSNTVIILGGILRSIWQCHHGGIVTDNCYKITMCALCLFPVRGSCLTWDSLKLIYLKCK